jgi:hypothetical protein
MNNTMLNKNHSKKYSCILCEYYTNYKKDYEKHMLRKKHKTNIEKSTKTNSDKCDKCEKNFRTRQSLWYHNKKCVNVEVNNILKLTNLVNAVADQNAELHSTIVSRLQPISIINTTNNNNINTFNLNFFLNETCKDAMNIDEFIDSIEISIQDLKHLGKAGYVEGMADLFIKNLEELDVSKRPLHCSDLKRETVHIRDKNKWEKENDQRNRLTKVMIDIARLNTIALQNEYKEKYPNCMTDYKSKEHEEYGKIAYEAFGGKLDLDNANKKLLRSILKRILINKCV